VDPGKCTGYVIWNSGERTEGELSAERFLELADQLISAGDVDAVVCERYIITVRTAQLTQAPWSLEQIGVLRFLCKKHGIEFHLQNVSDAKKFGSETRLTNLGWKRPRGGGHARDAQRHLLVFLVRHGWTDDRLLLTT
jgi:hypothetical protein